MGYILDLRKELGSRPLIMAGAGVIIINDKNEILLGKRTDNGYWDYPAGSMEIGESFEECARREVFEETGLTCGKLEYFMELSGEDTFYEYPNGDQVYLAVIIYICRDFSGELKVQEEEVYEQRFFPIDRLPKIPPLKIKTSIFENIKGFLNKE
ncbi:NUDIX hydrolase [Ruminococcus sp.]|uniref:NUDIX hydrolase n=1 Tax=Ruminococcus sp. TaxID=41978 RepID=UPI0025E9D9BE|nr:NUDIX hydrolase [Ruminococcus sp.]MBQ6251045.1 NUDIX hydrolase [Ruminococcus sp.]MBR3666389.1 NUDIX hydrolase [Ruminococcus sp.]